MGDLLHVHPEEIRFFFVVKRRNSCVLELRSKTDQHVAFKFKTTDPKKYYVKPNVGVVEPGSSCNVTVTMQPQREAPPDLKCNDRFLLLCVVVDAEVTANDINLDMFKKESGKVHELKMKVTYILGDPPSPVPEDPEEGVDSIVNAEENDAKISTSYDHNKRASAIQVNQNLHQEQLLIAKLTNERNSAIQINQNMHRELELLRKESSRRDGSRGFSFAFVALVGLLSIAIGYFLKKKVIGPSK